MRLAAIYFENHEFENLFKGPQTINFGCKYIYVFENIENDILVKRKVNENYIPNFFTLTNLQSKITNLNAIVGQNGAGKSTILDIIRSAFIENENKLPQSESLFLAEIEEEDYPIIIKNNFKNAYINEINDKNKLKKLTSKYKPQTIYYSPHYDYKYNPNFDDIDSYDISFDKIIEEDLKEFMEKDTNEDGWPYSASQELLFKNSIRQINFLSSDLIRSRIFDNLFDFQLHYEPVLHFRGYTTTEKNWNTPYAFREILKIIENKLEVELANWNTIIFNNNIVNNQIDINKYILKRKVIKSIISLLYRQIERKNTFLFDGNFPFEELHEKIISGTAYDNFLLFINHAGIKSGSGKIVKIFKPNILIELLEKIYFAIDKTQNVDSITNGTLRTSTNDAIDILKLQMQFLNELNSYYVKFYKSKYKQTIVEREKIDEFINYMPFKRRMSSGEGALLNFFSRIYNFLNTNLKDQKSRKLKIHYILLLDEADLTFHITWKKKYIKALLSTLPYFFYKLKNKPTLEIIFTTHDPITLSDLPNTNVTYIKRNDYCSPSEILDLNDKQRPLKTFGANISDLVADSFFIDDSLIGNFAHDKIHDTIEWLNKKDYLEKKDYYKSVINIIDEPIIQRKLAEMYDDKTKENFQANIIEEQIKQLQEIKKKLSK